MIETRLPFQKAPLIHCITNGITNEYVANALHAFGAKPIMVEDLRGIEQTVTVSDAVFLNMGHLTTDKEACIRLAMSVAHKRQKPVVIDVVGISVNKVRQQLTFDLLELKPTVVKGNVSEMRYLCGLPTLARGVDSDVSDNEEHAVLELANALQQFVKRYPQTTFLATGETDIVVDSQQQWLLKNGVPYLDRFSGSGDVVGAMCSAMLVAHKSPIEAVVDSVSYFNVSGECANQIEGIGTFRIDLLNKLEKVQEQEWVSRIKGKKVCINSI